MTAVSPSRNRSRTIPLTLTGLLLTVAGVLAWTLLTEPAYAFLAGENFAIYREAAARWLGGGGYFLPDQLAGPYTVLEGHVLYPPVALVLFVPFTALPAALWWIVPLGIIAWRVVALRPSPWGWVGIAACIAFPMTVQNVHAGNPLMWVAAFMALATRWPWVSALILVKPTLLPFALFGVRHRSWWVALGVFGLVSLVFWPLWWEYIAVIRNARGPLVSLLYSLKDVPLMLIPLIAWWSRRRDADVSGQEVTGPASASTDSALARAARRNATP